MLDWYAQTDTDEVGTVHGVLLSLSVIMTVAVVMHHVTFIQLSTAHAQALRVGRFKRERVEWPANATKGSERNKGISIISQQRSGLSKVG